jgi:uncharacterized protein
MSKPAAKSEKNPTASQPNRPEVAPWVGKIGTNFVEIRLKVVPGSRKDEIVGTHGDRLKIKVAAPPENGKANESVCALIARKLSVPVRAIAVIAGASSAEKIIRIDGVALSELDKLAGAR